MIGNRTVALCDILGFKERIRNDPLDKVVTEFLGYIRQALYSAIHQKATPGHVPSFEELRSQDYVGFGWFSDTMLFYSLEDTEEGHGRVIQAVAWLTFQLIFARIGVRAGISYGEMHVDEANRIYVGQALVDAHKLEERQEWSGAAITKSAEKVIPENARKGGLYPWYVVPYDVPVKLPSGLRVEARWEDAADGQKRGRARQHSEQMLAIDWTIALHHASPDQTISAFAARPETRQDIVRKWQNTKRFHDKVCRSCRKGVEP